jgi:hypothetical protein
VVGLFVVAIVLGVQAVALFFTGPEGAAIALSVCAGCMATAGFFLLMSMRKLDDARPRRVISVDPSRYLANRHGQPVTVDALRRARTSHRLMGAALIVVCLMGAAVATLASGASGEVYALVMVAVSIFLVFPAMAALVVDELRINRAIDVLTAPQNDQRP